MGRQPKDTAPTKETEPAFELVEIAKSDRETKLLVHQLLHPDEEPNWHNYRTRVLAWQKLLTLFSHIKVVQDAAKAQAQLFRAEKDGLKEWYEHERVEKLEDLVEQLGQTLWNVLSPYISDEHRDTARAALDAAVSKLGKR